MPIIYEPEGNHSCAPGWTTRTIEPGKRTMMPEGTTETCIPPRDSDHPEGSIWWCHECGSTWIVQPRVEGMPGMVTFAAEGRIARWRRERRLKREHDAGEA